MPLNDDGWQVVTYDDALINNKQRIQQIFGSDVDVSDSSIMGKIAGWLATKDVELDNSEHEVYDNASWETATGVSLDRLASSLGIQRHQAQYSQATLEITGQAGYLIPENTEFITDNGDEFLSDEDTQIGQDGKAELIVHSLNAASDTNVDAHTINQMATPVEEVETIDNPVQASGGTDLETDYDFRQRGKINADSPEGTTTNGIRTALINVNGVSSVTIQENNTKETDSHGNPANSIHAYVVGGLDDDIFQALANNVAGGATTIGKQSKEVDVYGNKILINFDRALQKTLYFKVNLQTSDGYDEDATKQSVEDYLSDFSMGDEIIINKLYQYLYQLSGIQVVNDIQISTDGTNYSSDNIKLETYEFAVTHDENIQVIANE